jgi:hypothetical protein
MAITLHLGFFKKYKLGKPPVLGSSTSSCPIIPVLGISGICFTMLEALNLVAFGTDHVFKQARFVATFP